jgi:hypothetical protein|tara:strand:- start:489 stop:707 length:219 start_codon:yes stop_codon:yes gene_type:complete
MSYDYDKLKPLGKVQIDVVEALRGSDLEPDQILSVLVSISVSVCEEIMELPDSRSHIIDRLDAILKWAEVKP